ncbi:hypothetical protein [Roseovarius sp. S1116L3]
MFSRPTNLRYPANRAMKVQVDVQEGEVMAGVNESVVYFTPDTWKGAA